ncbi:uncharacterized protein LOC34624255 [Cyclospora cayetanensis]|uniref:Uncharacterized protein LOC34624255 n=1 Tax=Cyclospora cayetanensis TaxID=88456 RepID=A0A6P6RXA8_9EIME|nr:uncharacterized protein LOC34624255 [Cyclospora cayetanensis]
MFAGDHVTCLNKLNEARMAAGLENFTAATDSSAASLPDSSQDFWKPVCSALLKKSTLDKKDLEAKSGTYAFTPISDSHTKDCCRCNEAIRTWKAAFTNFTGLPPSKDDGVDLYKDINNVSLVAMYNAQTPPVADCRIVKCTEKDTNALGVVCLTTPDAFKDGAPFT